MKRILEIGAGGVGAVTVDKLAQIMKEEGVFSDITVANRSLGRPLRIKREVSEKYGFDINVEQVDANSYENVVALLDKVKPDIVVHNAIGYQNFPIQSACLERRVNYIDTATPEVPETPGFTYQGQWDMDEAFQKAGVMSALGIGFDPGVTSHWIRLLTDRYFGGKMENVRFVDIVDCNAGDHHRQFATNFDPEINAREVNLPPKYFVRNKHWRGWLETPCITEEGAIWQMWEAPGVGKQRVYILYHEELESIFRNFPNIERGTFRMSFSEYPYLEHMRAFKRNGLTSSTPLEFESNKISPKEMMERISPDVYNDKMADKLRSLGLFDDKKIEFRSRKISPVAMLGQVLPKPDTLAEGYTGKTSICDIVEGITPNGRQRRFAIYNVKDHHECYLETGQHGISYTAGVPPAIAAKLIATGEWSGAGVFNAEQLPPEPFARDLMRYGLPYVIEEDTTRVLDNSALR